MSTSQPPEPVQGTLLAGPTSITHAPEPVQALGARRSRAVLSMGVGVALHHHERLMHHRRGHK